MDESACAQWLVIVIVLCNCIALKDTVPCPHCGLKGLKSSHWHLLSGALGVHLWSTEVSGVDEPQAEAMQGVLRICGMIRTKVVDLSQQAIKQRFVVEVMTMCESRLPLFSCTIVRHIVLHFYEVGGWADDLAVAPPISK